MEIPDITRERFFRKVLKTDNCWLWRGSRHRHGYGNVSFMNKIWLVHRFAWVIYHGELPAEWVLHSCDNRACVRREHLWLGDAKDNARDMMEKNRFVAPIGIRNGACKLSELDVLTIRNMWENGGISKRELALEYNITSVNVSYIIRRKTWRHI